MTSIWDVFTGQASRAEEAVDWAAVYREQLPRVLSIGRLDINTEGLLLLTNDGGLARALELPDTGWLRRYRVRAHGDVTQAQLDELKKGVEVDGVKYGSIDATLERDQGANVWLVFAIREGKNREVRNVMAHLGLEVNRLIRVSFGPFELGKLKEGEVEEVPTRVLREQIGGELEKSSQSDFDAPVRETPKPERKKPAPDPRKQHEGKSGERSQKFDGKRPPRPGERSDKRQNKEKSERSDFRGSGKPPRRDGEQNLRRGGKRTPFRAPKGKR